MKSNRDNKMRDRAFYCRGFTSYITDTGSHRVKPSILVHMKTNTPVLQRSITSVSSVRLVASPNAWIESEAVRQLYAVAALDGVLLAVGFPDLHPSQSAPVGSAFITADVIYPHLIGNDIGCGMALFKTDLARRDLELDRCAELRFDLEHAW